MFKVVWFIFIIQGFCVAPAMAQSKVWSLKEVLTYTLANNPSLQLASAKAPLMSYQMSAQKARWQPNGSFNMHGDVEKNQDGLFSTQGNRLGMTPSLNWIHPIGAHVQAQVTHFVATDNTHSRQTQWQLSLEQSLLKGANWSVNYQPMQDLKIQNQLDQWQRENLKLQIIYQAIRDYANLVHAWDQFYIQENHLKHHWQLQKLIDQKIQMGQLAELDGMMIEIQSARFEQQLYQVKQQIAQLSLQLVQTMGGGWIDPLKLEPLLSRSTMELSKQAYLDHALEMAVQANELTIVRTKAHEKVIRDEYKWDLRFKAHVSKGRRHYRTQIEGFEYPWQDHTHAQTQKYMGLYLTIPLNQKAQLDLKLYQNKLNYLTAQSEINEKNLQVTAQMEQVYSQLDYWKNQIRITEKSRTMSLKTRDIVEKKYMSGFSTLLDLQQADLQVLQAVSEESSTKMNHFLAQVELDYFSGILSEHWTDYVA